MPLYTCQLCNYSTKIKSQLNRHNNTKKHQARINGGNPNSEFTVLIQNNPKNIQNNPQNIQNDPQNIHSNYNCDYCDKQFTLYTNKRRHELHRCKHRYDNASYKKLFMEEKKLHQKEKKELRKQIEILLDKVGDTTINNNNTQNIQLNSYGKEDLNHITDSMKTQMLKIPYGMIPKMIEAVHFNNDKPENKNIAFTNKKDNKIKVYTNDKWIFKDKEEILTDLIDGKYFILDTHYDNVVENLNKTYKTSYEKFRTFYDENDKILHDQLKKDCELLLLNNR